MKIPKGYLAIVTIIFFIGVSVMSESPQIGAILVTLALIMFVALHKIWDK